MSDKLREARDVLLRAMQDAHVYGRERQRIEDAADGMVRAALAARPDSATRRGTDFHYDDPDYGGHEGHEAYSRRGLCEHPSHAARPAPTLDEATRLHRHIGLQVDGNWITVCADCQSLVAETPGMSIATYCPTESDR